MQRFSLIEVSMGEPGVVKALEALWKKLVSLGEANLVENQEFHDRISHESIKIENKGHSVTDFQCKLLELQLQYIQSLLKDDKNVERTAKLGATLCSKPNNAVTHQTVKTSVDENKLVDVTEDDKNNVFAEGNCNKDTQTSMSGSKLKNEIEDKFVHLDQERNSSYCRKHRGHNTSSPQQCCVLKENVPKRRPPVSLKNRVRNMQGHYHVKLSDVPFILGTSTSSHSVVANVQKIISMMKNHNRALCSSATERCNSSLDVGRHQPFLHCHRTCSESDLVAYQDVKDILGNLTKELSALTLKQENLRQKLENVTNIHQRENCLEDYKDTGELIHSKANQIDMLQRIPQVKTALLHKRRRHRSMSECSSPEFCRNSSTSQDKDFSLVKHTSKMEVKRVVCSYRRARSLSSGCDRRRMMQELREFQVQLQHEDICWR